MYINANYKITLKCHDIMNHVQKKKYFDKNSVRISSKSIEGRQLFDIQRKRPV